MPNWHIPTSIATIPGWGRSVPQTHSWPEWPYSALHPEPIADRNFDMITKNFIMTTLNARKTWDLEPPTSVQLGSMNFSESSRMRVRKSFLVTYRLVSCTYCQYMVFDGTRHALQHVHSWRLQESRQKNAQEREAHVLTSVSLSTVISIEKVVVSRPVCTVTADAVKLKAWGSFTDWLRRLVLTPYELVDKVICLLHAGLVLSL